MPLGCKHLKKKFISLWFILNFLNVCGTKNMDYHIYSHVLYLYICNTPPISNEAFLADPGETRGCSTSTWLHHSLIESPPSSHGFTVLLRGRPHPQHKPGPLRDREGCGQPHLYEPQVQPKWPCGPCWPSKGADTGWWWTIGFARLGSPLCSDKYYQYIK